MPEQRCLHCNTVAFSLEHAGWCRLCGSAEVVPVDARTEPVNVRDVRAAMDAYDLAACSED